MANLSQPRRHGGRLNQSRPRLAASERRQQLLDVAGRLFAENGYHGLSMEQLAQAAGVSKPVLYQHFASKHELYLGLVRDAIAEMEEQVVKALEGTRENKARVHGAIAAYFDFIEDRRFQLLFGTAGLADTQVRAEVEGATQRLSETVGALIAEDAGLDREAAALLARGVQAIATEGARWWLDHEGLTKKEAVDLLARLMWRGLGSFGPAVEDERRASSGDTGAGG